MDTSESQHIDAYLTKDHVILSRGKRSLWCCKRSGELLPGSEFDPSHIEGPVHLGKVWGCVGKLRFFTDGEWKLVFITQAFCVGTLPQGGKVYCVEKISVIPLTTDPSAEIIGIEVPEMSDVSAGLSTSVAISGMVGAGIELSDITSASATVTGLTQGRPSSPVTLKEKFLNLVEADNRPKEQKDREKVERRLTEALLWMFNDSQSFYFSTEFDLTQSLQQKTETVQDKQLPMWKKVDERFFWNKWMLTDLIKKDYQGEASDPWILPLIQGYVEIRQIPITTQHTPEILQPGWNERYAEKRRSLSMDADTSLKMGITASLTQEALKAIVPEEEGSGYETDSESENSENFHHILDHTHQEATNTKAEDSVRSDQDLPDIAISEHSVASSNEHHNETGTAENETTSSIVSEERSLNEEPVKEEPNQVVENNKESSRISNEEPEPAVTNPSSSSVTIIVQDSAQDRDQQAQADTPSESVPRLSHLCKAVLRDEVPHRNRTYGLTVDREHRDDSAEMSNFDSDYFANTPSHASDDDEWVAVKEECVRSEGVEGVEGMEGEEEGPPPCFTLAIISRRSRNRAGTRYRRRGVDNVGHVANYVETEMLAQCGSHVVSYVIVRGSVPVYWTQPGYKYRPPPVIERSDEETQEAFQKHFDKQLDLYNELILVNLVKQSGKEKVLSDAYEKHILLLNNPKITYIVFDFHQHFKTNQGAALKSLLRRTHDITRNMKFCWLDIEQSNNMLCRQESVFRVNCMDCLDRTNVMQSVFAREVLQSALHKLAVIPFEEKLEGSMLISFKEMWGNNGDFISKQYTGTVAMKGDITRYGERKLAGMMKDGYNSAQRYYMNIFRDTYRQVLIDLMQGVNPAEAFSSLPNSMRGVDELEDSLSQAPPTDKVTAPTTVLEGEETYPPPMGPLDHEEAIMDIIQHCKRELFSNKTLHLQSWALMEAAGHSFVSSSQKEELCILIQCRETSDLTFVSYSMEIEQIVCLLRIPMDKIHKVVIGPLGMYLRSTRRLHMRIYYSFPDDTVCYFTFRTVPSTPSDDDKAVLLGIADALSYLRPEIEVSQHKITKKKSPEHEGIINLVLPTSFVKSLDEEQSHGVPGDDLAQNKTKHHSVLSNESITSGSRIDENEEVSERPVLQSSYEKPMNGRSHSCDDILSSLQHEPALSPVHVPTVTVTQPILGNNREGPTSPKRRSIHQVHSDSQISSEDSPIEASEQSDSRNGTLKRASSDTMLNAKENDSFGRFTKFTGKLFQNLLSVGKSFKRRTSTPTKSSKLPIEFNDPTLPTRAETSETNEDSDTSLSRYQWPRKLQQRFRTNLRAAGAGWSSNTHTEPPEDETKKQEMRARSKSKIIIV